MIPAILIIVHNIFMSILKCMWSPLRQLLCRVEYMSWMHKLSVVSSHHIVIRAKWISDWTFLSCVFWTKEAGWIHSSFWNDTLVSRLTS